MNEIGNEQNYPNKLFNTETKHQGKNFFLRRKKRKAVRTLPFNLKKIPNEDIMSTGKLINVDNLCTNPENHKSHLCELQKAGKTKDIARLGQNPTFVCNNCGAKANTEGALCAPGPFHD